MNNVYIEFVITGTIAVNESDKDIAMAELSKLISAFLANKDIINLENSIESLDTIDLISYRQEPGEA
jgi:hypothetical protein